MQVSIIIVNYNTFTLSCSAIRSVIKYSQNITFEIILVDNASTECPPECFLEIFSAIKLIKSSENLGFAKGNNLGITQAKGKYILLLNSDAALKNNAIEMAVARMDQELSVGVLSSKLLFPDGRLQHPAQRFESLSRELRELFRINKLMKEHSRSRYYLGEAFDHENEIECDWVWGTFFMFRKKILTQLPEQKLADHFFMYAEDLQWCYQIKKLRYKILYFPAAEVIHHLSGSDTNYSDTEEKYYSRLLPNMYQVLRLEKGYLYALLTYLVRTLHLLTLRNLKDFRKAKHYLKLITKQ